MKKKKYFGKRALLNLPGHEGTAAISAEMEDTSTWPINKNGVGVVLDNKWQCEPNAHVKISDCTRTIELSIEVSEEDLYENSLHKIDTMIEALSGLRTGIVVERQRYVDRVDNLPKSKN